MVLIFTHNLHTYLFDGRIIRIWEAQRKKSLKEFPKEQTQDLSMDFKSLKKGKHHDNFAYEFSTRNVTGENQKKKKRLDFTEVMLR